MQPKVVTVDDQPGAAGGAALPARATERAPSDQSAGCSVATPRAGASGAPWFLVLAGLVLVAARRRRQRQC
jgi:MYXO-CTERM domain-containing protein